MSKIGNRSGTVCTSSGLVTIHSNMTLSSGLLAAISINLCIVSIVSIVPCLQWILDQFLEWLTILEQMQDSFIISVLSIVEQFKRYFSQLYQIRQTIDWLINQIWSKIRVNSVQVWRKLIKMCEEKLFYFKLIHKNLCLIMSFIILLGYPSIVVM